MKTLLSNELLENIGSQSGPHRELVTRRDIKKYAVAVGNLQSKYVEGDQAPPLFHIALFWDVVGLDALSTDGLSEDPLLPEFPLSRAMAGGSRMDYVRDILDPVETFDPNSAKSISRSVKRFLKIKEKFC